MASGKKKKPDMKKKSAPAVSRRKIPAQPRTDRPVSRPAAGPKAAPSTQNRQKPASAQSRKPSASAPKKPAPGTSPANKRPTPKKALRNTQKTSPPHAPSAANAARGVPSGSAPASARKTVRKNAPKPVNKKQVSKKQVKNKQINRKPVKNTASGPAKKTVKRKKESVQSSHKYHGGNFILYYMLAGVIVITVFAILANTVLFRCSTINVSGNLRYTAEEIAERSMIEMGKNLLHINTRQAEENIVSSLAYIDAAKVKRSFPTGINITVTEAEKWFYIRQGNTTAAVSHGGKIIEHSVPDGLTVFSGYEPESVDIGVWLKSEIDGKNNMPETILNAIEKSSLENVDEVELEDRFSIKMHIDGGRVILELGTIADMESKLMVANELIRNKIAPSERVTVLLSNHEQATVIPEKISDIADPDDLNNPEDQSEPDDSDDQDGS